MSEEVNPEELAEMRDRAQRFGYGPGGSAVLRLLGHIDILKGRAQPVGFSPNAPIKSWSAGAAEGEPLVGALAFHSVHDLRAFSVWAADLEIVPAPPEREAERHG